MTRATKLREGTPLHLYLPGPHVGVFNEAGLVGQPEIILCEALIDALTFWCAGLRNVTSSYGIEGFTPDILAALKRHGVQRVLIAYDADEAGNAAAEKLAAKLIAEGFDCYRVRFPKGMDANAYALAVRPAAQSLGLVVRQAEWMGNGAAPHRDEVPVVSRQEASPTPAAESTAPAPAPVPSLAAAVAPEAPLPEVEAAVDPLPATPAAPLPHAVAATIDEREVIIVQGDRRYRVRGLSKNGSDESLKVNVHASRGERFHLDTLDLYQAKARATFVAQASIELDVEPALVKADLGAVLGALEQAQDARARGRPHRRSTRCRA